MPDHPAPEEAGAIDANHVADDTLADDWPSLRAQEQQAIRRRRQLAQAEQATGTHSNSQLPTVGLALSGGGIRSATFALGLMRGLAQNGCASTDAATDTPAEIGPLGRVDYLSTVSGGGYIGAMYGRLIATYGMQRAQQLMMASQSPVLGWLRRNGRYLTPGGARDTGTALVT
jgi:predicted acylesterase/phospholipase RssA